jgi:hypothetical protein
MGTAPNSGIEAFAQAAALRERRRAGNGARMIIDLASYQQFPPRQRPDPATSSLATLMSARGWLQNGMAQRVPDPMTIC